MKKLLLILLIFPSVLYGQIENGNDFLNFSLSEPQAKHAKLGTHNGWQGLGTDQYFEDGKIISEMNYLKVLNGSKCFLLLRNILDENAGRTYYATKLTINNELVFNKWKKDWIENGIRFVKDPKGGEKWITPNEQGFTILLEKKRIRDIFVYEISIIN